MKAVILAGGLGTRFGEETKNKPKPMIKIGDYPIIWHIMKLYSHYGINEFVICCGYKKDLIFDFFNQYATDKIINTNQIHKKFYVKFKNTPRWYLHLIDTGTDTMTGGRIKRIEFIFEKNEVFFLTYGDGLSNVDIIKSLEYHKRYNKLATITAVHPPSRFGALEIGKDSIVKSFKEKVDGNNSWINGGFFILSSNVINLIKDDKTIWESEPLETLASNNELAAFKHYGFWKPMDTLREKNELEKMWSLKNAEWKLWD